MLSEPHWLILIFPLLCLVFWFRPDSKIILSIRILLILVLCFALSSPIIKIKGREGVIVVVADRSSSMPVNIDKRIQETTGILLENMPINSKLGLVSFNDKARIEFSPTKNEVSALSELQNTEASKLSDGIELGLSLIPDGVSGRIIVVSDGLWNGNDPQTAALAAINRNIPIDYRHISRSVINDLAVSYLNVPKYLEPNEPFILRAGVESPLEQNVDIELLNGDKQIFKTNYHFKAGLNELNFSLCAPSSSVAKYIFKVTPSSDDSQPQNNVAQAVALVKGKKPVLIINESVNSTLKNLLDKNDIQSDLKKPRDFSWNIEDLSGYSAVVLENIPAESLGFNGMHSLSAWIKHMGGGLLITGGKNSYGNGGYYQSPLEEALPVSLEMRSQMRKVTIAIAVVLDRSGSMMMQVGGRTKMDLANLGAAASLDLLSPMDEFGVLAVDTTPHVILPLQDVKNKNSMHNTILTIQSMGGGIYVYDGIEAAIKMLKEAKSQTRHIILFSDANDSEKPGEYWKLLDYAEKLGMTLSVIGLGKETDSDGEILKKIAEAGRGRCYFTDEPEELPRLFSQDTFIAAKSTFVEEPITINTVGGINSTLGTALNFNSSINAYNICYLKPEATSLIVADDEEKSPILSTWQYGLGKVACYTGVTGKEQGGEFLNSDLCSKVFCNLCDWLAFDDRNALGEIVVSQRIENGIWKVFLNLDPERLRDPFSSNPSIDILTSSKGRKPNHFILNTSWETADQLSASYEVKSSEVITSFLSINEKQKLMLAPACQIYSPEFLPQPNRNGAKELKKLAKMTGGNEVIDLSSVWATMPMVYQDKNISNFLFAIALVLFLLEISERRLALFSIILSFFKNPKNKTDNRLKVSPAQNEPVIEGKTIAMAKNFNIPADNKKTDSTINDNKDDELDVFDALKKAKKKADRRM